MTADEVRAALWALIEDDHVAGRHDLRDKFERLCPACQQRGSQTGHYERRLVNVCSRPEAGLIVARDVWVEETGQERG